MVAMFLKFLFSIKIMILSKCTALILLSIFVYFYNCESMTFKLKYFKLPMGQRRNDNGDIKSMCFNLGSYIEIPWTRWLIHNGNVLFIALEARTDKSECQQVLGRSSPWLQTVVVSSQAGNKRLCSFPFSWALIPFLRAPVS
jgi:hypothetical protein